MSERGKDMTLTIGEVKAMGLAWGTCKLCGSRKYLRADHVIPERKGGPTTLENLQTLCRSCNSRTGVRS